MNDKQWIQQAIKKKGALTRQAQQRGLTPMQFANKVLKNKEKYSAKTVKRAVLAKTLAKLRKKK